MDSAPKRKGFMKGKLVMSFYRAAKPASSVQYSSSKVKPSPPSSTTVGYLVDQEFVVPSSNKKVSFLNSSDGVEDQNVDTKAASYISCVQERFKLERANSERRAYQVSQ